MSQCKMLKYRANDPNPSKKGFGEKMYEGSAALGKFQTFIGLFIAIPIGIVLIVIGGIMLSKKDPHTKTIEAEIIEANCNMSQTKDNNKYKYDCGLKVKYTLDEECTPMVNTSSKNEYKKDQKITIYYNPDNVCDAVIKPVNYKAIGGVLLGIGILVIGGSIFSYYMARRFKMYGAAVGAGTAVGVGTSAFEGITGFFKK